MSYLIRWNPMQHTLHIHEILKVLYPNFSVLTKLPCLLPTPSPLLNLTQKFTQCNVKWLLSYLEKWYILFSVYLKNDMFSEVVEKVFDLTWGIFFLSVSCCLILADVNYLLKKTKSVWEKSNLEKEKKPHMKLKINFSRQRVLM